MEIQIKPAKYNTYPVGGILIKGQLVYNWIKEIQRMGLSYSKIEIFPIPNITANSIWGCLIIGNIRFDGIVLNENQVCQTVTNNLYIAEHSILIPALTEVELGKFFSSSKYIIHPEFGMVELSEVLNLGEFLVSPSLNIDLSIRPAPPSFIPMGIKSFQIVPPPPEEILKNMEDTFFPKTKKMNEDPLTMIEKGKLSLYKLFFKKNESVKDGKYSKSIEKEGWLGKLESFIKVKFNYKSTLVNDLQQDFEELDRRNQKQIDRLMDLFKNDPFEALKYAIPLDESGTNRGGNVSELVLSKRWFEFSLGNQANKSDGGGTVNLGDYYYQLQSQYNSTAESLLSQKEYQKAAFVYMKLLKNYIKAAEVLEEGKLYQEAAAIYLKHANNKVKAAECYVKGNLIVDAISLYKELNENEKVADLYRSIGIHDEAYVYYQKVIDEYKNRNQYIKASLVYKNKLADELGAQSLLIEGWRTNKDAFNCLNNYFSHIRDYKLLNHEIKSIYKNDVNDLNREEFLKVIWYEYKKNNELTDSLKEMAYEIISIHAAINPSIVSDLKLFNSEDLELQKDTMRFSFSFKNRKK